MPRMRTTAKRKRRKLPVLLTRRRLQVVITTAVGLSLIAGWTMLAYSGSSPSAPQQKTATDSAVSPASLTVASKEYIYGPGGRLLATEEAQSSAGPGLDTIGLYDPAASGFFLRNSNTGGIADVTFTYGAAGGGWIPITGDWNGDGVDTIGLYDPVTSGFFLRNSNTCCIADVTFTYGPAGAGWKPITGDWDGV